MFFTCVILSFLFMYSKKKEQPHRFPEKQACLAGCTARTPYCPFDSSDNIQTYIIAFLERLPVCTLFSERSHSLRFRLPKKTVTMFVFLHHPLVPIRFALCLYPSAALQHRILSLICDFSPVHEKPYNIQVFVRVLCSSRPLENQWSFTVQQAVHVR